MASGRLQHRIDPSLQEQAEEILQAQGIKPAQAIVLFYTEVKRSGGLPFRPSPVLPFEIPNARLRRDLNDARTGKGVRSFATKKEMFESLRPRKA